MSRIVVTKTVVVVLTALMIDDLCGIDFIECVTFSSITSALAEINGRYLK